MEEFGDPPHYPHVVTNGLEEIPRTGVGKEKTRFRLKILSFHKQDIFPDRASERKILDYQVKCPNENDGCQWIGELRNAEVTFFNSY